MRWTKFHILYWLQSDCYHYKRMMENIKLYKHNETWTLVPKPIDKNIVSCKWVFTLKMMNIAALQDIRQSFKYNRLCSKNYDFSFSFYMCQPVWVINSSNGCENRSFKKDIKWWYIYANSRRVQGRKQSGV